MCPLQVFQEVQGGRMSRVIARVAENIRCTAMAADAAARAAGEGSDALELCGASLQRLFSALVRGSESSPAYHCLSCHQQFQALLSSSPPLLLLRPPPFYKE